MDTNITNDNRGEDNMDNNGGTGSELGLFTELVALFGAKKGSDIYFVITCIKLILIAVWLFWCCTSD